MLYEIALQRGCGTLVDAVRVGPRGDRRLTRDEGDTGAVLTALATVRRREVVFVVAALARVSLRVAEVP